MMENQLLCDAQHGFVPTHSLRIMDWNAW